VRVVRVSTSLERLCTRFLPRARRVAAALSALTPRSPKVRADSLGAESGCLRSSSPGNLVAFLTSQKSCSGLSPYYCPIYAKSTEVVHRRQNIILPLLSDRSTRSRDIPERTESCCRHGLRNNAIAAHLRDAVTGLTLEARRRSISWVLSGKPKPVPQQSSSRTGCRSVPRLTDAQVNGGSALGSNSEPRLRFRRAVQLPEGSSQHAHSRCAARPGLVKEERRSFESLK